jgi:hypothetical protein
LYPLDLIELRATGAELNELLYRSNCMVIDDFITPAGVRASTTQE